MDWCQFAARVHNVKQGREEAYLYFLCNLAEIHVCPARRAPCRQERAAYTGVHEDETLIVLPQIPLPQDAPVSPEIVARIFPRDSADVRVLGDQSRCVGLAVENEDKVGAAVDALLEEKFEISPRPLRFRVNI